MTQLSFNFTIYGVPGPIDDGAVSIFNNVHTDVVLVAGDYIPDDLNNPDNGGIATGTMSFTGDQFDQAVTYFSLDGLNFSVDTISYTPAVPEPATMSLLAMGALGLLKRRRAA